MIDFSNKDDLNKIISENTITIIQYGAATCMPCHSIKNKITKGGNYGDTKSI